MRSVFLIICLTLLAAGTAGGLLNDGVKAPDAARILRRSDQVMGNMLVFYVSVEVFSPAAGERIESYSMVVHNKHCAESSRDDPDCFCASDSDVWEYFDRAAGGMAFEDPWSENYLPGGTRARDLQIAGDDLVAGSGYPRRLIACCARSKLTPTRAEFRPDRSIRRTS
jgi:hypothetical protein